MGLEYIASTAPFWGLSATTEPARPASACLATAWALGSSAVYTSSPTCWVPPSGPKTELRPVWMPFSSGLRKRSRPAALPWATLA